MASIKSITDKAIAVHEAMVYERYTKDSFGVWHWVSFDKVTWTVRLSGYKEIPWVKINHKYFEGGEKNETTT